MHSREIHLASRPMGWPTPSDFALREVEVDAGPDDVVVRNRYCSVDPYMRGRMNDGPSYAPPYRVGEVMWGGAVGEVLTAPSGSDLGPGDLVTHGLGWREVAVGPSGGFRRLPTIPGVPPSAFLGVLGMPGMTAYVGLLDVASMRSGDVVFVSGAAGAVGSMVGQLARLRGASRVIGSAGSADKVAFLTDELGFDAAFDYHDGPVRDLLSRALDGRELDVYFDNVGGEHLEAAIGASATFGRVAMCGAISAYNASEPAPGPPNLGLAITRRLRLQGFIVSDHDDRREAFHQEVAPAVVDGRIRYRETVVDGIDHMVDAFLGLLQGANTGKMVVRVGG